MYQEVYFNRGTEVGGRGGGGKGELMWATRSAPPVILCLLRAWGVQPSSSATYGGCVGAPREIVQESARCSPTESSRY